MKSHPHCAREASPPKLEGQINSSWLPGRRSRGERGLVEWNRLVTSWELQQALRWKKEEKAVNQSGRKNETQHCDTTLTPPTSSITRNAQLRVENSRGYGEKQQKNWLFFCYEEQIGHKIHLSLGDETKYKIQLNSIFNNFVKT